MYSIATITCLDEEKSTQFQQSESKRNLPLKIYALVSCISEFYLSYGSIYNPFNEYDLIDIKDRQLELVREPCTSCKVVKHVFEKQTPLKTKLILIAIKASYFVTFGILPLIAAIFAIINRIIHKPHFLPKVSDNRIIEIYNALQKIDKLKLKKLNDKDVDKMRRILGTSTFSKIKTLNLSSIDLHDEENWKNVPGIDQDYLLRQICLMFPKLGKLYIKDPNKPQNYSHNVKNITPTMVTTLEIVNLYHEAI